MGDLAIPFLVVGWAAGVLAAPVLVLLALDVRERGLGKAAARHAKLALWIGTVVYAGCALAAFLQAKNAAAPAGIVDFVWSGVARLSFLAKVALVVNGASVFGAWWIVRDEEHHPDRATVDAALAEEREEEARRRWAMEEGNRP